MSRLSKFDCTMFVNPIEGGEQFECRHSRKEPEVTQAGTVESLFRCEVDQMNKSSPLSTDREYRRTSISGTTFSGKKCPSGTIFHAI
jgi:hypothetical protein